MKKILFFFIVSILGFPGKAPSDLVNSNNEFALKIYKSVLTEHKNLFVSPFGLNIALAIANEGAATVTRQEIEHLLCLEPNPDQAGQYNYFIRRTLNLKDSSLSECYRRPPDMLPRNEINLANSIWTGKGLKLSEPFQNTVTTKYYSEIFDTKKMDNAAVNDMLYQWISEKTRGKITKISKIRPDQALCIINAIYFKGTWDQPFDRNNTQEGVFYAITGEEINKDFMNEKTYYRYYENSLFQALMLPYHCYQFSMWVILPKNKFGLDEVENSFSVNTLQTLLNSNYGREIILSFPKFRIESDISLKGDLMRLGYRGMFSDQADFSQMTSSKQVKLDEIVHKTFIEIDEEQTEAAAVTKEEFLTIGFSEPSPTIFCADHPFMFIIMDNRTGAILFMGRYVGFPH